MRHQVIEALDRLGIRDQARVARAFGHMVKDGTVFKELAAGRKIHQPTDLPSGWLLYLTQANLSRLSYHESGRESVDYIEGLFAELNIDTTSVVEILDFGCG